MNCSKRGIYRYTIQRDTITTITGHETLRRECYFPVAVISLPVTDFEADWRGFPAVHWGKWFRFLRILSGESFLFLERS